VLFGANSLANASAVSRDILFFAQVTPNRSSVHRNTSKITSTAADNTRNMKNNIPSNARKESIVNISILVDGGFVANQPRGFLRRLD